MPAAAIAESVPMLRLHRFSYEIYERMVERGFFAPDDRIELLDGLLVEKLTKGARHSSSTLRGQEAFRIAMPAGWHVRPEQPIALRAGPRGDSAPEPDLAIVVGDLERYAERHPTASEVGLVLEIAASPEALAIDRAGLARYAHAGIPVACIADVEERRIEVYRSPLDGSYRDREILLPGQDLAGGIGTETTGPAMLAPVPISAFFAPGQES